MVRQSALSSILRLWNQKRKITIRSTSPKCYACLLLKKLSLNLKVLLFPNEVSIVLEHKLFLEIIGIKASHCVRLLSHTGRRSALCAICANYYYKMGIRNPSHIWNGGVLCHFESLCNFNGPICVLVDIREVWINY